MRAINDIFLGEVARQLAHPSKSMTASVIHKVLESQNAFLSKTAVKLLKIEPHHRVLEASCAGGVGLRCAADRVEGGTGKIYGVDMSEYMVQRAKKFCALEIAEDKVEVHRCFISHMPFYDNFFDRVYHCNSFYFWPNLSLAAKEIFRVTKPGGIMVTTLYLDGVKKFEAMGVMRLAHTTDPLKYCTALELAGFTDLKTKYMNFKDKVYQATFAVKPMTPINSTTDKEEELKNDIEEYFRVKQIFDGKFTQDELTGDPGITSNAAKQDNGKEVS